MLCLHSTGLRVGTANAPGNTLKISVMGSFTGGLADFDQTRQLPLTIPCATGQPLAAKYSTSDRDVFPTLPSNAIQAPFVVDDIIKRSWGKVAIFADSSGYGEAGLKDAEAALADELKAARAAGANVMFSYTVDPENAVIASPSAAPDMRLPPFMPAVRFARSSLSQTTNPRC